jgi:hypothetical protein
MANPKRGKRERHEQRFPEWEDLENGGRIYSYRHKGSNNYTVRYVKVVDEREQTVSFYQELYDNTGKLIEIHQKYPVDTGHKKVG